MESSRLLIHRRNTVRLKTRERQKGNAGCGKKAKTKELEVGMFSGSLFFCLRFFEDFGEAAALQTGTVYTVPHTHSVCVSLGLDRPLPSNPISQHQEGGGWWGEIMRSDETGNYDRFMLYYAIREINKINNKIYSAKFMLYYEIYALL